MSLRLGTKMENMTYMDIETEFRARVAEWHKLEGYVANAIIRDALHRVREFSACWERLGHFVQNYIECVESLPLSKGNDIPVTNAEIWACWGVTLRLLEIG